GGTCFGLVDPGNQVLHALSELGFIIFLFQVGLELDIRRFLGVMPAATAVALVGVILPFALGFLFSHAVGLGIHPAVAAGAATSLGVTARFLSDLNRLEQPESAVILGGAILGNIFGLLMLGMVIDMMQDRDVSVVRVVWDSSLAYGFLLVAVLVGLWVTPRLF